MSLRNFITISIILIVRTFIYASTVNDTISINEVSITAIKQGSELNRQAISASTLSKKEVEQNNIVSVKNISEIVPNFYIPDYGSRMTSSIYIRGIGTRIDQPVIGLNLDNIPILNKDNYDFNLIDIAKIDMLRGPQSTLYGRNAMGGVINISTLSPINYQGIRILGEYSKGNTWRGALSYYTKISGNLGIGIVGNYYSTDGLFTNKFNGKKCDWEHSGGGRLKISWVPNHLNIENTLAFTLSRQGGYPYQYEVTKEINYNDTCFYKRNTISDGLTIRYNLNGINISSISSYQYIDDNMTLDQDFLPISYFTLTQAKKEHAVTQDFIAKGNNNKYNWLYGLFGFHKNTDMNAPVTFLDDGITNLIEKNRNNINPEYPIRWNERELPLNSIFDTRTSGAAIYHQSNYTINNWDITFGLRLDYEHNSLKYNSKCNSSYTIYNNTDEYNPTIFRQDNINIDEHGNLGNDYLQLLPKFAIEYSLKEIDSSLFASISKGYKSGGFNTQMFSDVLQQKIMSKFGIAAPYSIDEIVSYKPEHSWNYEIGANLSFLDNKIKTDLSLYYINVSNQQLTIFPEGTTTGRIMTNAGKSRSFGGEMTLKFYPVQQLELNVSYGYTNAKFKEYNNGKSDFSGKYIPYAPINTAFLEGTYTIQLQKKSVTYISFNAKLRGIGKIYWDEYNEKCQPYYSLLGSYIQFGNKHYSLQLWGENITNTKYNTFYFVSMGNSFVQRGKTSTFGATLRIDI